MSFLSSLALFKLADLIGKKKKKPGRMGWNPNLQRWEDPYEAYPHWAKWQKKKKKHREDW